MIVFLWKRKVFANFWKYSFLRSLFKKNKNFATLAMHVRSLFWLFFGIELLKNISARKQCVHFWKSQKVRNRSRLLYSLILYSLCWYNLILHIFDVYLLIYLHFIDTILLRRTWLLFLKDLMLEAWLQWLIEPFPTMFFAQPGLPSAYLNHQYESDLNAGKERYRNERFER